MNENYSANMYIPLTKPYLDGTEEEFVTRAIQKSELVGDGPNTKRVEGLIGKISGGVSALLTPSCTNALDLSAILLDLHPEDEVIVPGFTFTSTATAFAQQKAKLVFADIEPDTLNIDAELLETLITEKTRAIALVHYAGIACDMEKILNLSKKYGLKIIEDNAHGFGGYYMDKALGSIGDMATLSFHVTKNIQCGEGGAFLTSSIEYLNRAQIVREKGTNRKAFLNGEIDKYTWVDHGSSFLMPDYAAAFLEAQLEKFDFIQSKRMSIWNMYFEGLQDWAFDFNVRLPTVPSYAKHTAHMFWLKTKTGEQRKDLLEYLNKRGIGATFHYQSLASSPGGIKFGKSAETPIADNTAETLVRLPIWPQMTDDLIERVIKTLIGWSEK